MQQANQNCSRHPKNTITHFCTLVKCHFRLLCQQCIAENRTHVHNHIHNSLDKVELLVKLENEIHYQKYQRSLQAQFEQQTMHVRHFKRLMNKLCEQIKELQSTQQKESIIQDKKVNEMKQEFEKLKTGNLSDLHYHKLKFSENEENIQIQNFQKIKTKLQIINQDMKQANWALEQILNYKVVNQKAKQIKEITEDIFYKNCQKMCEELENMDQNYYNIKQYFSSPSQNIEQEIQCLIGQNCQSESGSQLETEVTLKGIVISIYILCKEMKYDLQIFSRYCHKHYRRYFGLQMKIYRFWYGDWTGKEIR